MKLSQMVESNDSYTKPEVETISENEMTHNVVCADCGKVEYGPTDKFGADDQLETINEENSEEVADGNEPGTVCSCGSSKFKVEEITKESMNEDTTEELFDVIENATGDTKNKTPLPEKKAKRLLSILKSNGMGSGKVVPTTRTMNESLETLIEIPNEAEKAELEYLKSLSGI